MHTGAALLAALAVMLVSLVGVIFTAGSLGAWMRKYLTYLATLSAGVFLIIAFHLANEAVEEGGWLVAVSGVLLGALLMEGIHYLLPNKHHHHGHAHDHAHSPIDGRRVLISDALHNVGDGILLVGAFASNIFVGIAATIGVLLHEAVQEISEYFVLREAGYTHGGALVRSFAVSATILIGIFVATYLSSVDFILALLSGIAAGGFLSVVFHDLLPHAIHSVRANGGVIVHVVALLLGATGMFALQSAFPHEEASANVTPVIETTATITIPPPEEPRPQSPATDGVPTPTGGTRPSATSTGSPTPGANTDAGSVGTLTSEPAAPEEPASESSDGTTEPQ